MRTSPPVLAALAASIMMTACAADPAGAKEQHAMTTTDVRNVFPDPKAAAMAQAIADGDIARIRALAPQTDLSVHGDDNVTLLEWAIWNKSTEALATLLDVGADPALLGMDNETVAHMAATVNDPKYLKVLIEHKAPIDVARPDAGWTPLFRAVLSRRDPQVDMLIKAGADIHRVDGVGDSLLHVAAQVNDADQVLHLLELGVDPNLVNAQGSTFQGYLFQGSEERLNTKGKQSRRQVRQWLQQHGIATQ